MIERDEDYENDALYDAYMEWKEKYGNENVMCNPK